MKVRELPLRGFDLNLIVKAYISVFCEKHTGKTLSVVETGPTPETTPTEGDTSTGDAAVTHDAAPTLEDLAPILELCEQCYKLTAFDGILTYCFVNQKLLHYVRRCGEAKNAMADHVIQHCVSLYI